MLKAPCKDCPDRYLGCHSKCEKYIDFQRRNEEIKALARKANQTDYDYYSTFSKHRKGGKRC